MLNEEEKTNYFIDLYVTALRAYWQNTFLKKPNPTSERYEQLNKARIIIDTIQGEYSDFINFQFQSFRHINIAPKPAHLISDKAIKRYQAYQKQNNRYHTKEYSTNGDWLTVAKTRKIYPITQIISPVSQDPIAIQAYDLTKERNNPLTAKQIEAISYLIAKLKYKGAQVPKSIQQLEEEG